MYIYRWLCVYCRAEASCARLAELNPYVSVKTLTSPLDETTDLSVLKEYQVIVLQSRQTFFSPCQTFCPVNWPLFAGHFG